jgi:hypothetical protein
MRNAVGDDPTAAGAWLSDETEDAARSVLDSSS